MVRNSLTAYDAAGEFIYSMYLDGDRGWCLYERKTSSYSRKPNRLPVMPDEIIIGPKTLILWSE